MPWMAISIIGTILLLKLYVHLSDLFSGKKYKLIELDGKVFEVEVVQENQHKNEIYRQCTDSDVKALIEKLHKETKEEQANAPQNY
jgi:hypothetical protein